MTLESESREKNKQKKERNQGHASLDTNTIPSIGWLAVQALALLNIKNSLLQDIGDAKEVCLTNKKHLISFIFNAQLIDIWHPFLYSNLKLQNTKALLFSCHKQQAS